jgi:acetyl-CoA C-acetyltransferase
MKVFIKGTGLTKFGELWDKTLDDLILEASNKALTDARLSSNQIEAVFIGNMLYGKLADQDHLGALATSLLGINCPATRVEGACASGGLAVQSAYHGLLSGQYKNVLVIGAEKMTDASTSQISHALMGAGSEAERQAGLTFPGLYALMAKSHMQKFGTTRNHLASVSVKNHYHASLNPNAQYPYEINIEKALSAPVVSDPFTIFDASPITDGAAAVVLSTEGKDGDVFISASESATDILDLSSRDSFTEIKATQLASQKAYKKAGITPEDIDLLEVHDCFTIAEIMAMEDLGFCKKGSGGEFISSGKTKLGGKTPVNTSGGLKACGHPVGATGVKQIIEIADQLKGSMGSRQVKDAKIGLTQNVGGTGATVVVHILQK